MDLAEHCEDGEKWSELVSLKATKLEVYTDTLEVRMWEKGGKNKPMGFDLNHQKNRTARSSVFRREEPKRPSNRDIEWTLRSEVKKGFPGWRYKFGSHHMFEESYLCLDVSKNGFIVCID